MCCHTHIPSVKIIPPNITVDTSSDHLLVKLQRTGSLSECHCQVKYSKVRPSFDHLPAISVDTKMAEHHHLFRIITADGN